MNGTRYPSAFSSADVAAPASRAVPVLSFERIPFDPVTWGALLADFPDRTVFQTPAWLNFVAETQHGEPVLAALKCDGQIAAYFTGVVVQKFGVRILGSPFPGWTTAYMGFNFVLPVPRRAAVDALRRFAFDELGCLHLECMDRSLQPDDLNGIGFEYTMHQGFEGDLSLSEDQLFASMTSRCRGCIRKAMRCGVTVEPTTDLAFADDYYNQLKDVFAKWGLVPTYDLARVRALIRHLLPTGMLALFRARDPEGRCIATSISLGLGERMFMWGEVSLREYQILRPNELLVWEVMRYWKSRGVRYFDTNGDGEYKRKFGVYEIAVPWFRASKYPVLLHFRKYAERLAMMKQRLAGKWSRLRTNASADAALAPAAACEEESAGVEHR